jgi:lysophospholipase L1-like esterase
LWLVICRGRAGFWATLPVWGPSGCRLRTTAPRFSAAPGQRAGAWGSGAPVSTWLGFGDSIVDGVGLAAPHETMPAQAAKATANSLECPVAWRTVGRSGADAASCVEGLLPTLDATRYDVIVVSVGVNDVTGLRRTSAWRSSVRELSDGLLRHSPGATVVFAGLPPLSTFPLLTPALQRALGARAEHFDAELRAHCALNDATVFVPTEFEADPSLFGEDGYHPNASTQRIWGERVSAGLLASGWRPRAF